MHTKLSVWWGINLADSFNNKNLDVIVSSLLLHDLQKFGKSLSADNKPTLAGATQNHGPVLASQMASVYGQAKIDSSVEYNINLIVAAVALHMGRWGDEILSSYWKDIIANDQDRAEIVKIVHLADYCSSKKVDDKMEELDNYKFVFGNSIITGE